MASRWPLFRGRLTRKLHLWFGQRTRRRLAADSDPTLRAILRALEPVLAGKEVIDATEIEACRQALRDVPEPTWEVHPVTGLPQTVDLERAASIGSKGRAWCQFLAAVVQAVQPQEAIEFGTLVGISTAYQAQAMTGRLTSIELNGRAHDLAAANLASLGLDVDLRLGRFDEVLDDLLDGRRFQYAFKDGAHTYEATVGIFERMVPHMDAGAVFVFDDIRWSQDMHRAWNEIRRHPAVAVSVDLFFMGLVIVGDGDARHHRLAIPGT